MGTSSSGGEDIEPGGVTPMVDAEAVVTILELVERPQYYSSQHVGGPCREI